MEEKHENLNKIQDIKTMLSSATFSHVLVSFEQYVQPKKELYILFEYFMEKLNEIVCKCLQSHKTKLSLRELNIFL